MRKFIKKIWLGITSPFRFIARVLERVTRPIRSFFTEEEQDDSTIGDSLAMTIENPGALLPHVYALRKHLLRAVLVIVVTTAISFILVGRIMEFLASPIAGGINELIAIDVTENIGTVMRVTLLGGFTLALPYVIFEIYLFVAPALSISSRIKGLFAIPVAISLFIGGMAFAFFVMLPTALPFLFNFMGLTTQPRPSSYFNFVTLILFWVGVMFEFPLIIFLLASLGLVNAKALISQWRLAIVIMAVLAAAITPTVDPVNMGLVMSPMIVLYFISIGLASIAQRNRARKQEEALKNI